MSLHRVALPADSRFWPAAARAVVAHLQAHDVDPRRAHAATWLVPAAAHAAAARGALHAAVGAAFMPPRIAPLAAWLGQSLASGLAASVELYGALRGSPWIASAIGSEPATLWTLAREISALCDELTLAAAAAPEAFDGRLRQALERHYRRRAARALQAPSQLVLQLWHARRSADDGAARALRELAQRAQQLTAPLAYLAGAAESGTTDALAAWEQGFLQRAAERVPTLLLVPDAAAPLDQRPLLAAAWPELRRSGDSAPLAARADALDDAAAAAPAPLAIVATHSLEEEAIAVAEQVLAWRRDGAATVALVALDRLTARRVRALLERAQVSVRDETGWRLSTTSAAAAVMRWYDLVDGDLYWRDLLDWLKSPFTLAQRPMKDAEVGAIERAIRASGALQGTAAMLRALAALAARDEADAAACEGARELLQQLDAQVQLARRAPTGLAAQLQALQRALDALGMREALSADAVGRTVLAELDVLEPELAPLRGRGTLADFRALLGLRFEEASFVDAGVDSPIVMVSLAATALRGFDAAILVGADAAHLPAAATDALFMSQAVRAELGLATAERSAQQQAAQLASLLATVPRVVATWRTRRGDEPNALSPLLARLQFVAQRATGDDLLRAAAMPALPVAPRRMQRPAPGAGALLPARIAASHAQSLVDCAYQFYARRMLGLAVPEDVVELPDKREFGLILHRVLRRFHAAWGGADFAAESPAGLQRSLREHAQAVFAPEVERAPALLAFERRFDGLVPDYVAWLQQHAALGWRWAAGEVGEARELALADGRVVELAGRIDRIDARDAGDALVIDYKARPADELKRGLRRIGEDVQLPFYGLLLPRRPQALAYVAFDRARPDAPGVVAVEPAWPPDAAIDAVQVRLHADLQRIADGAPLPAIGSAAVCARCEMRGLCRRDHWDEERWDEDGADAAEVRG